MLLQKDRTIEGQVGDERILKNHNLIKYQRFCFLVDHGSFTSECISEIIVACFENDVKNGGVSEEEYSLS